MQIVDLGIGAPGSIKGFILAGLGTTPSYPAGEIITQGIGVPSTIKGFLLTGLGSELSSGPPGAAGSSFPMTWNWNF